MHKLESEMENDREHRFKPHKLEADWPKEGGQEEDCTRVKMTVLKLTVWERGSDEENRKDRAPRKLIIDVPY